VVQRTSPPTNISLSDRLATSTGRFSFARERNFRLSARGHWSRLSNGCEDLRVVTVLALAGCPTP
jgi:hypothetical protein